jgi:hypothetical protein
MAVTWEVARPEPRHRPEVPILATTDQSIVRAILHRLPERPPPWGLTVEFVDDHHQEGEDHGDR